MHEKSTSPQYNSRTPHWNNPKPQKMYPNNITAKIFLNITFLSTTLTHPRQTQDQKDYKKKKKEKGIALRNL